MAPWIKRFLTLAGVGEQYSAHSVRCASVSYAKDKGVKLDTIIKTAGWSTAKTFAKFYDKHIKVSEERPYWM